MEKKNFTLSLVVPAYNEEESIQAFIDTIDKELEPLRDRLEIVFVNDGSRDRTRKVVEEVIEKDPRVTLVNLARNFGKEAAMTAGLHHARGDAVIPMDVDLQDPPSLILEFVRLWQDEGYDTVYGVRTDRNADTAMKRLTAGGFYRLFNAVSTTTRIPENAGDFRLMDRRVVEVIKQLPERNRFMKGLFAWPVLTPSACLTSVRPAWQVKPSSTTGSCGTLPWMVSSASPAGRCGCGAMWAPVSPC